MSWLPGFPSPQSPALENMLAEQQERELERKAELHAQLHPDEDERTWQPGGFRRGLRHAWTAIRRRG